jgi:hypothetical protein
MNKRAAAAIAGLAGLMLAGCAGEGGMDSIFTTGSIGSSAASEPRVDPACVTLSSRIEALRKEGIGEKIEKAAAKKYKMTQADLNKADQLTKANAEFQMKCSPGLPRSADISSDVEPVSAPPPAKTKGSPRAFNSAEPVTGL